jgi:hypothetical protein
MTAVPAEIHRRCRRCRDDRRVCREPPARDRRRDVRRLATALPEQSGLVGPAAVAARRAEANASVSGLGPAPGGEIPNQSSAFAGLRWGVDHAYSNTPAIAQSVWPSAETVRDM